MDIPDFLFERVACAMCAGGYLRIYSGSPVDELERPPTSPPLAELRFSDVAFDPPVDGAFKSRALTPDSNAAGGGIATWFRAYAADGKTPCFQGTIGSRPGIDFFCFNRPFLERGACVSLDHLRLAAPAITPFHAPPTAVCDHEAAAGGSRTTALRSGARKIFRRIGF
jgi:hypothetical protein